MVLYILAVAVLNLLIGFATAAHLGRRCREVWPPFDDLLLPPLPSSGPPMGETNTDTPAEAGASTGASASTPLASDPAPIGPAKPSPEAEPAPTSREAAIHDFKDEIEEYEQMLAGFDERLRSLTQAPEADQVDSCLTSLRAANEEYLGSRERVCAVFEQLHREWQEFQPIRSSVEAAIERQTQQIASTNEAIARFDRTADLKEGCRQIADETGKLLEINHQLRDSLDEALIAVARDEKRIEAADESQRTDPLTGLANRTGLEWMLTQWWESDPQRKRSLTAAMIDVDEFSSINQRYGHAVGNRVLWALSQLLTAECKESFAASRYAGQRFVLLFGDADIQTTTRLIERIRQLIELARVRYRDEELKIRVSCAITQASAEDTSTTLVARALATLQEAKRYGRNRTFIHEGAYPTPVAPPNFSLESRSITI